MTTLLHTEMEKYVASFKSTPSQIMSAFQWDMAAGAWRQASLANLSKKVNLLTL